MNISKTNWTLIVTIIVTVGNAVVPFMPAGVQATVTTLLLALASIFHVSEVNTASASAPKP
jgi:uncharacterized membrane protein YGL010W